MHQLLSDVNFSEIEFTRSGPGLRLLLIDMHEGSPLARIDCRGVCLLRYENYFASEQDGFACYVGEVTARSVPADEVGLLLAAQGYGFKDGAGSVRSPKAGDYCEICLEGGEVSLTIVCRSYRIRGTSRQGKSGEQP